MATRAGEDMATVMILEVAVIMVTGAIMKIQVITEAAGMEEAIAAEAVHLQDQEIIMEAHEVLPQCVALHQWTGVGEAEGLPQETGIDKKICD